MSDLKDVYRDLSANISATEFELYCMETLKAIAEKENLKDCTILHNQKLHGMDGSYQIDVLCEFVALGSKFKVIVECKKYSRAVERKVVTDLYCRVKSLGANKGIIVSSTGFQSGAVQFAKAHGITLIQLVDKDIKFIVNEVKKPDDRVINFRKALYQKLPTFFSVEWDLDSDFWGDEIYPTKTMKDQIIKEIRETST